MQKRFKLLNLLVCSALTSQVYATTDIIDDFLSLNGFGTVGVTHSSNKNGDVVSNILQPRGAGNTRAWSMATQSKLGLQMNAKFTPNVEAVLQVVSEENYSGNFKPAVEWANVRYKINNDWAVRAGRIILPVGMISEYRKVGYVNLAIQPNFDVYYTIPAFNSDGMDLTYTTEIKDYQLMVQGLYGNTTLRIPSYFGTQNINVAKLENIKGLNLTAEKNNTLMRLGYMKMDATYSGAAISQVFGGLRATNLPQALELVDRYENEKKYVEVIGAGFSTEQKNLIVQGEFIARNSAGFISDTRAWYLQGGYRFGRFTPYIGYSQMKSVSPNTSQPNYGALSRGINLLLNAVDYSQKTEMVGVKYDVMDNAVIKLQLDHIKPYEGSLRTGIIPKNGDFDKNDPTNVITLTTDFVF